MSHDPLVKNTDVHDSNTHTFRAAHKHTRIAAERCRRYKREAREVITFGQNYLNVLLTLLSVIFFFGCAIFFAQCFYRALAISDISPYSEELIFDVYSIFSKIILFLMLSPLYVGFVTYLIDVYHIRSANIGHVPHTVIFYFYSGIEFAVRAWTISLIRLIGIASYASTAYIIYFLSQNLFPFFQKQNTVGAAIGALLLIVIAILLFCVALAFDLYFKIFVIHAVMHPTKSLFSCLYVSALHMKNHVREGILLLVGFAPWILLSVLSAGILFLLYALPYILFSEISYCIHLMMEAK